ncbi:MAG: 2-oxoacid:ferredoxin oxidoreductase subunit beta, partial [Gemmatirosa sp.]|nr:2-oxoacid:ferredoxin oxidoreductase subunit beta [Gemmatirosa sp.]
LKQAHGFNSVHGRMPSVATGAHAANRALVCIGISGDGDSLSIGLGQLCHAIGRNVRMVYVLENNGVYGLTKGQFSASADVGSTSKRGQVNTNQPIDPVLLALTLGATFVARSFSGDKRQLVPILKAAVRHDGFALVDVISPCVSFNDHDGSTKSYRFMREHAHEAAPMELATDLVPLQKEVTATSTPGTAMAVTMHDGSIVRFRAVDEGYDPTNRDSAYLHVQALKSRGEIATGLLYVEPGRASMHASLGTVDEPLVHAGYDTLCPGAAALDAFQDELR